MRKVILVRIILIEQTQFLILYSIFVKNLLWIVLVIEEEVVQVRLRRVVVLVIEARFFSYTGGKRLISALGTCSLY